MQQLNQARRIPNQLHESCGPPTGTLKSTLHSTIFWEMVKFVDLGVLYFSLVLPAQSWWTAGGPEWTLRSLGG